MLIHGAHNRSIDFNLFAFEYSPVAFHPVDDWVEMDFHLKDEKQGWHVTDASLTAAEVMRLAGWLHDIGEKRTVQKDLYFMEPNLSFHLNYDYGKTKIILITFNAELRPGWYKEEGQYCILGHVGNRQLLQLAKSLTEQLDELYIKSGVDVGSMVH